MDKKTKNTKRIALRLPSGLVNSMKEIAVLSNVSLSAVARSAFTRYILSYDIGYEDYENEERVK